MENFLRDKFDRLPDRPGVYLFKDAAAEVLYIGKAASLKKRVPSYLRKEEALSRPNIAAMLRRMADLEVIVTDSEVEACILESNLIHEKRPYYNILLKDDKHFPYIKITVREPFPRMLVVRRVEGDGSRYFGPYTDASAMRWMLAHLRRNFLVRQCNKDLPLARPERPCLYAHLRRCLAPCGGGIKTEAYAERIRRVMDILSGKTRSVAQELHRRMEEAAKLEAYEQAAALRDQMRAVERIIERQKMDESDASVNRDVFLYVWRGSAGCMVQFQIREGLFTGRRHFSLHVAGVENESEAYSSFLRQHYASCEEIPREILLPKALEDRKAVEEWLEGKKGESVSILRPKRGEKMRLLELAEKNANLLLTEELASRRAREGKAHPALLSLERELALARFPRRIECFDVSTLQGMDTVASQVTFIDGKPHKREYRRYKIESVAGQDDFAGLREALLRRIRRLQEEGADLPDLFLLDGGKGQLGAGLAALRDAQIREQPIAAIAKRLDEIFLPGGEHPIMLPKHSPALRLIQRIRDEAHRFALAFHRVRRKNRTVTSELDRIPGIGPAKRQKLLRQFGSFEQVRKAGPDDLIRTVGAKAVTAIRKYFEKQE